MGGGVCASWRTAPFQPDLVVILSATLDCYCSPALCRQAVTLFTKKTSEDKNKPQQLQKQKAPGHSQKRDVGTCWRLLDVCDGCVHSLLVGACTRFVQL